MFIDKDHHIVGRLVKHKYTQNVTFKRKTLCYTQPTLGRSHMGNNFVFTKSDTGQSTQADHIFKQIFYLHSNSHYENDALFLSKFFLFIPICIVKMINSMFETKIICYNVFSNLQQRSREQQIPASSLSIVTSIL